MNFVMFKTINAEWVCGELKEVLETGDLILSRVRIMALIPLDEKNLTLRFVPYNVFDPRGDIRINTDHILAEPIEPNQDLIDKYIESTTDIQIVKTH